MAVTFGQPRPTHLFLRLYPEHELVVSSCDILSLLFILMSLSKLPWVPPQTHQERFTRFVEDPATTRPLHLSRPRVTDAEATFKEIRKNLSTEIKQSKLLFIRAITATIPRHVPQSVCSVRCPRHFVSTGNITVPLWNRKYDTQSFPSLLLRCS